MPKLIAKDFQKIIREWIEQHTNPVKEGAFTYHFQTRYGKVSMSLAGAFTSNAYIVQWVQYEPEQMPVISTLNTRLGKVGKMGRTTFIISNKTKSPQVAADQFLNNLIRPLL